MQQGRQYRLRGCRRRMQGMAMRQSFAGMSSSDAVPACVNRLRGCRRRMLSLRAPIVCGDVVVGCSPCVRQSFAGMSSSDAATPVLEAAISTTPVLEAAISKRQSRRRTWMIRLWSLQYNRVGRGRGAKKNNGYSITNRLPVPLRYIYYDPRL